MNENNLVHIEQKPNNNKIIIIIYLFIVVIISIIVAIIILPKDSKRLICMQEEDMSGMKMVGVTNISFKKNEVQEMIMRVEVELGEYSNYKDEFIESFRKKYSMYKEGIDVDITSDDEKIYMNLNANKETFKELNISSKNTYEEIKKDLEEQGFTCE